MKIIEFIQLYWSDIVLIFSVLFVLARAYFENELEYLKADIFSLVTDAEEIYGQKTGQLKLNFVVKKIYAKMPIMLRTFLTEKKLEKIIEKILVKARESWQKQIERSNSDGS
ncbi:MAG: hypothetical protein IJ279_05915 [Clostridia bacterium]|nr:hypothetical protein [Clostridia bacterium]